MRTILHLSDLHFGRLNPAVLPALVQTAQALRPDLVVVSGDLTQRARRSQFRAARDFLAQLPRPQLIVPGNHDVPLYNLLGRFLSPLRGYRRYICADLQPIYRDAEMVVVGISTARSLTISGGRVNRQQAEAVQAVFARYPDTMLKILVSHHPFDLPSHYASDKLVGRARMGMEILAAGGADLLLAGHLHLSHHGQTVARYNLAGHSALYVQAGTATSSRMRGEVNTFNLLHLDPAYGDITRYEWQPAGGWQPAGSSRYLHDAQRGWQPLE